MFHTKFLNSIGPYVVVMATDARDNVSAQSLDEQTYIDGRSHLEDVTTEHDIVLVTVGSSTS